MSENIQVYRAINSVQISLVKEGIAKDRTCQQGGSFKYRGIDDVYNVLAGLLADNKLVILPRVLSHTYAERTSNAGKTLFHSTVSVEYDFISAEDGSKHVVGPISGEAMDSGDKSAGKAMSYAYKAMAFQAFAIPTEGDNDPDSQAHIIRLPELVHMKQPTWDNAVAAYIRDGNFSAIEKRFVVSEKNKSLIIDDATSRKEKINVA